MGVQVFETEIVCAVPPKRLFKGVVYDFHNLLVKMMPDVIKSVDLIGDGGVGTIKQINLHEGHLPIKERIDAIDEDKLFYSLSVIEGGLSEGVEKIQNYVTFVATQDGTGTIMKRKIHFYITGDNTIDETQFKAIDEQVAGLLKGVEAYLLAHPDA